MKDYISVFKDSKENQDQEEMINGAMDCMDKFAECFDQEDISGMDECCYFPHYLISGNEIVY